MNVSGLNNRDLTATIRDVMRRHNYLVINDNRMLPYIAFDATDQKTHAKVFIHSDGEVGVVLYFSMSNGIVVQTPEFAIDHPRFKDLFEARIQEAQTLLGVYWVVMIHHPL